MKDVRKKLALASLVISATTIGTFGIISSVKTDTVRASSYGVCCGNGQRCGSEGPYDAKGSCP